MPSECEFSLSLGLVKRAQAGVKKARGYPKYVQPQMIVTECPEKPRPVRHPVPKGQRAILAKSSGILQPLNPAEQVYPPPAGQCMLLQKQPNDQSGSQEIGVCLQDVDVFVLRKGEKF